MTDLFIKMFLGLIFGSLIDGFIIAVIVLKNEVNGLKKEKSELIKNAKSRNF